MVQYADYLSTNMKTFIYSYGFGTSLKTYLWVKRSHNKKTNKKKKQKISLTCPNFSDNQMEAASYSLNVFLLESLKPLMSKTQIKGFLQLHRIAA